MALATEVSGLDEQIRRWNGFVDQVFSRSNVYKTTVTERSRDDITPLGAVDLPLVLVTDSRLAPEALYWSGTCLERLGRQDEARRAFEQLQRGLVLAAVQAQRGLAVELYVGAQLGRGGCGGRRGLLRRGAERAAEQAQPDQAGGEAGGHGGSPVVWGRRPRS